MQLVGTALPRMSTGAIPPAKSHSHLSRTASSRVVFRKTSPTAHKRVPGSLPRLRSTSATLAVVKAEEKGRTYEGLQFSEVRQRPMLQQCCSSTCKPLRGGCQHADQAAAAYTPPDLQS